MTFFFFLGEKIIVMNLKFIFTFNVNPFVWIENGRSALELSSPHPL